MSATAQRAWRFSEPRLTIGLLLRQLNQAGNQLVHQLPALSGSTRHAAGADPFTKLGLGAKFRLVTCEGDLFRLQLDPGDLANRFGHLMSANH